MKQSIIQSLLVSSLLFAGSQVAMAKSVRVNVEGVNYILDSESMTAKVTESTDVSGDVVLPGTVSYGGKAYALTSVGDNAFAECEDIMSVAIPSGVTSIGRSAFYGCTSLTSVTVPYGVSTIGDGAFNSCSSLVSADLPSSVTYLGSQAFCYCYSLASVTIPSSLTSISEETFNCCI